MKTQDEYQAFVTRAHNHVKPRIIGYLKRLGTEFSNAGYEVEYGTDGEPIDLTDTEYRYAFMVKGEGLGEGVDVSFEIAESMGYEGSDDGINFGLSIVAYGGEIIGGMCPYNYTSEVWTKDADEIERRMTMFEQASDESAVELVKGYATRKAARANQN